MGAGPVSEVIVGDWVIRLDGTVVEVLSKTGLFYRWHVTHVAVEARDRTDGSLDLSIGIEAAGMVVNGPRLRVPPDLRDAATRLFEHAREIRDGMGDRPPV